jgi:hypothetical protein
MTERMRMGFGLAVIGLAIALAGVGLDIEGLPFMGGVLLVVGLVVGGVALIRGD